MTRRPSLLVVLAALVVGLTLASAPALAQTEDAPPSGEDGPKSADDGKADADNDGEPLPVDDATTKGREAYAAGLKLAGAEQWGEALKKFQEAAKARDAPGVQYNIAFCQRALGRYVAGRQAIRKALADAGGLTPPQLQDAKGFQREFEQLIVRLDVTLDPPTALLSVDGRPLVASPQDGGALLAGVAPAGDGKAPGTKKLSILLDPGMHLFRATRRGHEAAVVRKSYKPGHKGMLDLRLDIMPATVHIESTPGAAIVRVGNREVGVTPVEFQRPAGSYDVEVLLDDYETYTAKLELKPGQRASFTAKLLPYEAPIYTRWWFWSGAVAVVAAGAVLTYALTRPEPEPPPYDGGNTGWVAQPAVFSF